MNLELPVQFSWREENEILNFHYEIIVEFNLEEIESENFGSKIDAC